MIIGMISYGQAAMFHPSNQWDQPCAKLKMSKMLRLNRPSSWKTHQDQDHLPWFAFFCHDLPFFATIYRCLLSLVHSSSFTICHHHLPPVLCIEYGWIWMNMDRQYRQTVISRRQRVQRVPRPTVPGVVGGSIWWRLAGWKGLGARGATRIFKGRNLLNIYVRGISQKSMDIKY